MTTTMRPFRSTDDIPAMQAFLEGLGLQARISSNRPGWVEMAGATGLVGLPAAKDATRDGPGETARSFEVDDADAATATLLEAGFDASVVDEAWSRVVELVDPDGRTMLCDARNDDLYGYTAHPVDPARPGARVVPICRTNRPDEYVAMLRALGVGENEVEVRPAGTEGPGVELSLIVIDPDGQPVRVRQG